MKILMTFVMMMAVTSAFAGECKLNGDCKEDADCKALNKDYAVVGGKCTNPKSGETETQCAGIVNSSGAKGSAADSATSDSTGTKNQTK
ncbi:MAG: hypothetical protein ACXVLQ_07330 [Bacteriovorax sp.]